MKPCRVRIVADAVQIDLTHAAHDGPCDLDDRALRLMTRATTATVKQIDHWQAEDEVTHVVAMASPAKSPHPSTPILDTTRIRSRTPPSRASTPIGPG